MKKYIFLGLIFALLTGFAFAQNLPQVTVVNNTGYTFHYLYLAPESSGDWGDDVLGNQILRDGQRIQVTLPYPLERERVYDFWAIDEDGDDYYKWDIRVTQGARVVFVFDDIDWY